MPKVTLQTTSFEEITCCKSKNCTKQSLANELFIIKSHKTEIDIASAEEVTATEIFKIENKQNTSASSIHIWLNKTICSDIVVQDSSGNLDFTENYETNSDCHLVISLRSYLPTNQSTNFWITYRLNETIPFVDQEYYHLEFFSTINYYTESYLLFYTLPERSFIHEDSITAIMPEDYWFDRNRSRWRIYWSDNDIVGKTIRYYFVRFESPIGNKPLVWLYVVGPILGVITGVSITFMIMKKKDKKTARKIGAIFLNESQRIILKTIIDKGGKISQSEMCRKTGFTQSKVSRNLSSLEEQGLVIKEKWGRNALIHITKTGEKVID